MMVDVDERMEFFCKESIYAYIKDIFGGNFNGYIQKIEELKIMFKDDVLGIIPIKKKHIKFVSYSKKEEEMHVSNRTRR